MFRSLAVYSNRRLVGLLHEQESLWSFEYAAEWAVADTFDLSPALPRSQALHRDGASVRPVQWYFDNLLPEENQRTVLAKEANIPSDDAFGLLAYFGSESAGSLVLCEPTAPKSAEHGLRPLPLEELSRRIANLPTVSLVQDAPKHMSLAGAQHKLLVVMRDGELYEPIGNTPSTHILKPNHQDPSYAASVANEFFCMRLAKALRLPVPEVHRLYVPEPVYLIDRFDREAGGEGHPPNRLHVIDACQLLNKSRTFKYTSSQLDSLNDAISLCRSRAAARMQIYRWVIFNLLIGNGDNHLKNVSFIVRPEGIEIASAYDLLSTAVYDTKAFAGDRAGWSNTSLALSLTSARCFSEVSRREVLEAGEALGLRRSTAERELDGFLKRTPVEADALLAKMERSALVDAAASPRPSAARDYLAGEQRVLLAIRNIVLTEMLRQLH